MFTGTMATSFQIGRVWGIPIRVHISLLIVLPFFAMSVSGALSSIVPSGVSFLWGLVAVLGLFASVAIHELGHSVVALRKGIRVRKILLLPIGGVAQLERMPTRPADEFHIAIAGPAVSLVLAAALWPVAHLLQARGLPIAGIVFAAVSSINLVLAVFNLIPSFPMDGGRIYRAWMTPRLGRLEATRRAAKLGRILAVVFAVAGLLRLNPFWVAIAVFIYFAAGAEYRAVRAQEVYHRRGFDSIIPPNSSWAHQDDEIVVSQPPYRRGKVYTRFTRSKRAERDFFSELFGKGK